METDHIRLSPIAVSLQLPLALRSSITQQRPLPESVNGRCSYFRQLWIGGRFWLLCVRGRVLRRRYTDVRLERVVRLILLLDHVLRVGHRGVGTTGGEQG